MAKEIYSKLNRICQVKGCYKKQNEFVFDGNICRIKLYDKKNKEIAETIIDTEDYEKVKDKKWYLHGGYASRGNKNNRTEALHWWIIGQPLHPYHTDHINGNELDNRKCNLRHCSCSQNQINRGKQKNNKSGYKGVSWSKQNKKWMAEIQYKGKRVRKGFDSAIEAAETYNNLATKYHGQFAYLNQI